MSGTPDSLIHIAAPIAARVHAATKAICIDASREAHRTSDARADAVRGPRETYPVARRVAWKEALLKGRRVVQSRIG